MQDSAEGFGQPVKGRVPAGVPHRRRDAFTRRFAAPVPRERGGPAVVLALSAVARAVETGHRPGDRAAARSHLVYLMYSFATLLVLLFLHPMT
jgi:hypothetical protein